ncbi:MAG: tRNA (guanosine(37)-N1)-methyltransferase TrmD [Nitrospiraceae bacterium]
MRGDVLTLFPELVAGVLAQSMLRRAQDKGLLDIRVWNLRDVIDDRHKVADDAPYGGGGGMVMKADPFYRTLETMQQQDGVAELATGYRLLMPSPQGRPFTQAFAAELSREARRLVWLCGHYEGIDERVRIGLQPEEVSIGDYVLTGGELAALVMIDAAVRYVPGVLGDPDSAVNDSFHDGLLDYPHYTRPVEYRGMTVPDVLLSGHHDAIRRWRREQALRNTFVKRPDLLTRRDWDADDRALLDQLQQEHRPSSCVPCGEEE